jgi:hypothetical protein
LGRYVVGVGVAGSTSRALTAACDEFVTYDALPGITPSDASEPDIGRPRQSTGDDGGEVAPSRRNARRRERSPETVIEEPDRDPEDPQEVATRLLERALRLGHEKDDVDWLHSSAVKSQMKRMDPSFSEKALGYRSFSDFVKSRDAVAELDDTNPGRLVRLSPARTAD